MVQVCVLGSYSPGKREVYTKAAMCLGAELGKRGWTVLLAGPLEGLLGLAAEEIKHHGGSVLGAALPEQQRMAIQDADAYFILPGGFETLRLACDVVCDNDKRALHQGKRTPLGVINVTGFFDRLLGFLHIAQTEGFTRVQHGFLVHHQVERVVAMVERRLHRERVVIHSSIHSGLPDTS